MLVAGDPIEWVRKERGDYATLIRRTVGDAWTGPWRDVDLRNGVPLPEPGELAGVVVTGSSSSVTERAPWMLRAEAYLRDLVNRRVPVFGICFGHQLLGRALGGEVTRNPRGREIGTVMLDVVARDELFGAASPPYRANATHVDTVSRLPGGARVLASTALEPNAAVRFSETTWGVQFHPEMDRAIVQKYLEVRRSLIAGEGIDPDRLLEDAGDAPAGASTLPRFAEIVATVAAES